MLRYRCNAGSTRKARDRFHNLHKVGRVTSVEGVRWRSNGIVREGVRVRGTNGTARFMGVLWGYSGEGPNGLFEMLCLIGLLPAVARCVAYETERDYSALGRDWLLALDKDSVRLTTRSDWPVWLWSRSAAMFSPTPLELVARVLERAG